MKIVFFGTGAYVLPILKVLNSNFDLSLVLTTEKNENGPVSKFCKENGIECLAVDKITGEIVSKIKTADAKVAVLAYFGMILPKQILELFPKGIINIHPSLLPKYRGPTPGQTAILNGDKKTGVTIIKLDKEVDHGPILSQQEEQILPSDTSETLYIRLFKIGSQLLAKSLPTYLAGELKITEQDHNLATFTKTLTRDSGFINIDDVTDKDVIENMIRAYFPWPSVWFKTKLGNAKKIIKLLPENKIQVEGKNPMNYKDFINGYKEGGKLLSKLNLI